MMLLLLHVSFAISSLVVSTLTLVSPSAYKLRVSYGLAAATLVSGTVLVVQTHTALVSACASGLAYVSFVLAMTLAAYRKLSRSE